MSTLYTEHNREWSCDSFTLDRTLTCDFKRIGVDSNHVYTGFLRSSNPELYFSDTTKETFKNAIYELQTLLGDGILVRDCFFPLLRALMYVLPHRSTDATLCGATGASLFFLVFYGVLSPVRVYNSSQPFSHIHCLHHSDGNAHGLVNLSAADDICQYLR